MWGVGWFLMEMVGRTTEASGGFLSEPTGDPALWAPHTWVLGPARRGGGLPGTPLGAAGWGLLCPEPGRSLLCVHLAPEGQGVGKVRPRHQLHLLSLSFFPAFLIPFLTLQGIVVSSTASSIPVTGSISKSILSQCSGWSF